MLTDVKHPYYGSAYYGDYAESYESVAEMIQDAENCDLDLNLLYRWDWLAFEDEDEKEDHPEADGMLIFSFIAQRKGYVYQTVAYVKAEEVNENPDLVDFLKSRSAYLNKLMSMEAS